MVIHAQRVTRTKEFAWLTLGGIPACVLCGVLHVCMAGHMQHSPYAWWQFALDLQWVVFFITAAVRVRHSEIRRPRLASWLLVFIVVFRFFLGSLGGGLLIIYDLPVLIYLIFVSVRSLRRLRESCSMLSDHAHQTI